MLLRAVLLAALVYGGLLVLVFLARHRLAFPLRGGGIGDPRRAGLPDGEVVRIETSDGERLNAWYLPPRDTAARAGAVIWFHGNAETVAGLGPILRDLRPERAALLAVEYRGYGGSTGNTTPAGTLLDAAAAWDWMARRPEIDSARLVIYGRSIGGGPAAWLAAHRPAAGLILESPFTSLRAMARAAYPFIPSALAGPECDNLAHVARAVCPVLIIHGERDDIVPPRMSAALAAAAGGRAEVWTIPGADHNTTYDTGDEAYARRFRAFVARVTAAP